MPYNLPLEKTDWLYMPSDFSTEVGWFRARLRLIFLIFLILGKFVRKCRFMCKTVYKIFALVGFFRKVVEIRKIVGEDLPKKVVFVFVKKVILCERTMVFQNFQVHRKIYRKNPCENNLFVCKTRFQKLFYSCVFI